MWIIKRFIWSCSTTPYKGWNKDAWFYWWNFVDKGNSMKVWWSFDWKSIKNSGWHFWKKMSCNFFLKSCSRKIFIGCLEDYIKLGISSWNSVKVAGFFKLIDNQNINYWNKKSESWNESICLWWISTRQYCVEVGVEFIWGNSVDIRSDENQSW